MNSHEYCLYCFTLLHETKDTGENLKTASKVMEFYVWRARRDLNSGSPAPEADLYNPLSYVDRSFGRMLARFYTYYLDAWDDIGM